MKLVVGIGGASGAPYARRLIQFLEAEGERAGVSADLVMTDAARTVWRQEIGGEPRTHFPIWKNDDFAAPFASGSSRYDAMCVVPCSAAGLCRIAWGTSSDLLGRAADVMLKERRTLVLCLRETPISLVHARAMVQAIEAGAVVLPASPGFYGKPRSIEELVDGVVARLLDRLGIPNELPARWDRIAGGGPEGPTEAP